MEWGLELVNNISTNPRAFSRHEVGVNGAFLDEGGPPIN